ncbi:hypothetical protein BH23GEM9_BH23GEM9_15830 [soil metagenome]
MTSIRPVAAICIVLAISACAMTREPNGATDAILRQPEDAPARFTTQDGVLPEDGCRVNIVDPRDQLSLRLSRSAQYGMSYHGDYEVPDGRYGVRPGELLRVDCSTGSVIGIVSN